MHTCTCSAKSSWWLESSEVVEESKYWREKVSTGSFIEVSEGGVAPEMRLYDEFKF